MRSVLLGVALAAALASLVGCASEQHAVLDPSDDPAFIPPGQGDLQIGADPEVKAKKAPRARKLQEPNRGVSGEKLQAKK
ncbi:MAG: hypothetical protein KIT84_01760 [Labilithrix sp.]|nr:hypothetical protein [Labilithrix sp.]MCW5809713.1 hypothetical protein [Labilithrix sp.]